MEKGRGGGEGEKEGDGKRRRRKKEATKATVLKHSPLPPLLPPLVTWLHSSWDPESPPSIALHVHLRQGAGKPWRALINCHFPKLSLGRRF